jgi:hypothetical protein
MKRFSIVHPFVFSFFSRDLYRDFARNRSGAGFLYLLLLLAICWIPDTIKTAASFSHFTATVAPGFINQVPNITITDGEVSISEPMPYSIKDPDSGAVIAILDTTGAITELEDSGTPVLLTKTKLIFRKSASETRVYDLSPIKSFTLTKERLHGWLHIARKCLMIAFFPICVLGSFVYRIVQALIYAAIGLIFASLLKVRLGYASLLRLSVVAVTPAVILDTLRDLTGYRIPAWGLICFLIAMGYLFFGVKASAETQPAIQTNATLPTE